MELQTANNNGQNPKTDQTNEPHVAESWFEEIDSTCSTPYVSAPSSPGRGSGPVNGGFYYSAPASPMHFALTASYPAVDHNISNGSSSAAALGFEFGSGSSGNGSSTVMSSADELFLDGKIRPMKLSSHLEKPQVLAPLLDLEEEEEEEEIMSGTRGRDMRVVRDKSMRRRTRSLSPLRSTSLKWNDIESTFESDNVNKSSASCFDNNKGNNKKEILDHTKTTTTAEAATAEAASLSASTSRSSSAGRSTSKRWVFLKDFLYRSKSEGRSNNKFWSTISFSPINKDKKLPTTSSSSSSSSSNPSNNNIKNKPVNGIAGKRRGPAPSPHELHYTAKRAQAEELRKKTFLPYRQGLLGCLGFSSKGYGAMNGFARALNPVSSR